MGLFGSPSRRTSAKSKEPATPTTADRLKACAVEKKIFDAHCHYYTYLQKSDGMSALQAWHVVTGE